MILRTVHIFPDGTRRESLAGVVVPVQTETLAAYEAIGQAAIREEEG